MAIVVPCFNEAAVIHETAKILTQTLAGLVKRSLIDPASFLCFIDDGSDDDTWQRIMALKNAFPSITGIKLARNYGHQYALLAGLSRVRGRADCAVSVDADLQDDITVIEEFLKKYKDGCDLVYGIRSTREPDSAFVRLSASLFYRFMHCLGAASIAQHADFRLTSKKVMDALENFREATVFLRSIFPSMGFKHGVVYYDRKPRLAGKTKYTLRKMLAFAVDGIISSGTAPLRIISLTGFLILLSSGVMIFYTLYLLLAGNNLPGWAATVLPIYFLGGIQLLSLGLLAEYIGRIFWEVKGRPRYLIEEELHGSSD